MIDILKLDSCPSTNTRLAEIAPTLAADTVVVAREQTAGRGQRGNSWEAAPGLNLTCSILMFNRHGLKAARQFALSEAVSLGIVDTLRHFLGGDHSVAVKWPNDIYSGDKKICGILIENAISGSEISRSIIGVGVNVNQREFVSGAPNPVSIFNLLGHETPVDEVLEVMIENIYRRVDMSLDDLHAEYCRNLWRKCRNSYIDVASGVRFSASIADVLPDGTLCLLDDSGNERRYLFKEVAVALD